MTTLKQQLKDLAAHKHSDLSIGNDAVDYIEELEANLAEASKGLDYYEEVLLLRKKLAKFEEEDKMMSKFIVELDYDEVDIIVIQALKDQFRRNNKIEKVDLSDMTMDPDYELLKAIQVVLAYYMARGDYEEWAKSNPMVRQG
jgi:hypothetical protein